MRCYFRGPCPVCAAWRVRGRETGTPLAVIFELCDAIVSGLLLAGAEEAAPRSTLTMQVCGRGSGQDP